MGGCVSCRSSRTFNNVRVVHLNGYVEDFDHPVTVAQVTGKPPRHFVCTPAQLISTGSKPMKSGTQLEPGHIYFLLPQSALQSDVSPVDMAAMARKLIAAAKSRRREQAKNLPTDRTLRLPEAATTASIEAFAERKSSKARSWRPILDTIVEKSFRSESSLREKNLDSMTYVG